MSLERFTYDRCCFISYKFHIDEFSVCEPQKSKILRGTKAQEIVFNILRELDMKYHRSTYVRTYLHSFGPYNEIDSVTIRHRDWSF